MQVEYLKKMRKLQKYTDKEIEIFETFDIPRRYRLVDVRGQGSYGVVVSAFDEEKGEKVAIKKNKYIFPKYYHNTDTIDTTRSSFHRDRNSQLCFFRNFISSIYLGSHPCVLSIKDVFLPKSFESFSDVYYVTDLMESNLYDLLDEEKKIPDENVKFIIFQLLLALQYIESCNFFHLDLKPENILINSSFRLKLCDFGPSKSFYPQLPTNSHYATSFVVSRWYLAPECILGPGFSFLQSEKTGENVFKIKPDVWSLGCIFGELIQGSELFRGVNPVDQLQKILLFTGTPSKEDIKDLGLCRDARRFVRNFRGIKPVDYSKKFGNVDPAALDLLSKMLTISPKKRISPSQALKHPYFEGYCRTDILDSKFQDEGPSTFDLGSFCNKLIPMRDILDPTKEYDSKEMKMKCFEELLKLHKRVHLKRRDSDEVERMEYLMELLMKIDESWIVTKSLLLIRVIDICEIKIPKFFM